MDALPRFLQNPIRLKLVLLYFGIVMLLPGLGDTPLVDWDENIYAKCVNSTFNYLTVTNKRLSPLVSSGYRT